MFKLEAQILILAAPIYNLLTLFPSMPLKRLTAFKVYSSTLSQMVQANKLFQAFLETR